MKKLLFTACLLAFVFSCQKKESTESTKTETVVKDNKTTASLDDKLTKDDAAAGKEWLTKTAQEYFIQDGDDEGSMKKITTPEYFEYKMDAMNVEMNVDGSLTMKQFEDKWKSKFDTSKAGIDVGFLISGQDWQKIEVTKCDLISQTPDSLLYDVVLEDKAFQAKYLSKVKLVKRNGQFLIADVLQAEDDL